MSPLLWSQSRRVYYRLLSFVTDLDQPTTDVGSSLIIEEGLSKDINCSVVSFPKATFTWHNLNTFEWMDNGTVLSFTNVSRSEIGYYVCNATNAVGEKQSIPFKLNVTCKYAAYFLNHVVRPAISFFSWCFNFGRNDEKV